MPACPHCGFVNPPPSLACPACGGSLSVPSPPLDGERTVALAGSAPRKPAQRTLLGIRPPNPPEAFPDSAHGPGAIPIAAPPVSAPTQAFLNPANPEPPTSAPSSAPASLPSLARTLLYVQAPTASAENSAPQVVTEAVHGQQQQQQQQQQQPAHGQREAQGPPAVTQAPLTPGQKKRTLLGLSPPQELLDAHVHSKHLHSDTLPERGAPEEDLPLPPTEPPVITVQAPPAAEPSRPPQPPAEADAPSSGPGLVAFEQPAAPSITQGRRLLGLAAALLLGLLAFFLWWTPPKPLGARLQLNDDQRELLLLTCENCPAGSSVRVGAVRASFENGRATLPLETPLNVGDNQLRAQIERPGLGRDENVALTVPVQYRLRTDLSQLSASAPSIGVEIEAVPGTEVELNGQPVTFEDGRALVRFAVPVNNVGQHSEPLWAEQRIDYVIRTPDGQLHEDAIVQRISVPPLILTAPGADTVVGRPEVYVAGRTAAGATVTVASHQLSVDSEGHFGETVPIATLGPQALTVRAVAAGHAARQAQLRVSRVADLERYAQEYQGAAVRRYSTLKQQLSAGQQPRVALPGRVESAASSLGTTTILLSVSSGCHAEPCLAKVIHGAPLDLEKGQRLSVFGEGTGLVQSPIGGREVPEISSSFVLR